MNNTKKLKVVENRVVLQGISTDLSLAYLARDYQDKFYAIHIQQKICPYLLHIGPRDNLLEFNCFGIDLSSSEFGGVLQLTYRDDKKYKPNNLYNRLNFFPPDEGCEEEASSLIDLNTDHISILECWIYQEKQKPLLDSHLKRKDELPDSVPYWD